MGDGLGCLHRTTPWPQVTVPLWGWLTVFGVILALLAVDLLANRRAHDPSFGRSVGVSLAWIGVSILFGIVLGLIYGSVTAQQYFAGYLVEKSLSIDNIFIFALLFRSFAVPAELQHRVLYYGVFGALVMRGAFIAGGAQLVDHFNWVLYIFGVILVVAGIRMLRGESQVDPDRNPAVRLVRRLMPVTKDYVGGQFFSRVDGRRAATPLLVALVAIEVTDVVFATDSIPAIFGITTNVFVIFTSNAFAVLGLRALYFVFADAMDRFRYLKFGLAALLMAIGVKLLLAHVVHISILVNLLVIVVIIGASLLASVLFGRQPEADS
jgi:tellurite resistance protein TerC